MTTANLRVQIAFQQNPLSTPTWTNVSSDVRGDTTIRRGRQTERDRVEAGVASLSLDNRTRKYDSLYVSGPYYGYILPNRPILIEATLDNTTYYPLFRGFVTSWTPDENGFDSVVRLRCVDAFKYFAGIKLNSLVRVEELSSDRIIAILNLIGWPISDRVISLGQSRVQIVTSATNVTPLDHMLDVAYSENGLLFMSSSGSVTFQDRHFRLRNTASSATFGNTPPEIPFEDISLTFDDTNIFNDTSVSVNGGSITATSSDASSQAKYLRRTLSRDGLLITSSGEAQDCADWLCYLYSSGDIRFDRLTLNGQLSNSAWTHIFSREISNVVNIVHRPPPGNLGSIQKTCFIEAIEHGISEDRVTWRTTWTLSPMSPLSFLTLDDTTLGRFDYNAFAY